MCSQPTILVIEDDDSIRRLCVRMLKSLGMKSLEAGTGAQALEHIDSHAPLSAVLLDVNLPDIGGPALAEWIRDRLGPVPIIYFTGSNGQELDHRELARPDTHLLAKPFTRESMSSVMNAALGAAQVSHGA